MISRNRKRTQEPFFSREVETARGTVRVEGDMYIEEPIMEHITQLMKGDHSARSMAKQLADFVKPYGIETTSIVCGGESWQIKFSQKVE